MGGRELTGTPSMPTAASLVRARLPSIGQRLKDYPPPPHLLHLEPLEVISWANHELPCTWVFMMSGFILLLPYPNLLFTSSYLCSAMRYTPQPGVPPVPTCPVPSAKLCGHGEPSPCSHVHPHVLSVTILLDIKGDQGMPRQNMPKYVIIVTFELRTVKQQQRQFTYSSFLTNGDIWVLL